MARYGLNAAFSIQVGGNEAWLLGFYLQGVRGSDAETYSLSYLNAILTFLRRTLF